MPSPTKFPSSDGLGGAVDGHFHDYDTVNGVSYVDLLQLEPRRGLASRAASSSSSPVAGKCGDTPNNMQIETKDKNGNIKCVDAVEPELNRAYDTLRTTVDEKNPSGDPLACPAGYDKVFDTADPPKLVNCTKTVSDPASEVYVTTPSGSLLSPDKPFLVTVANADLSTLGSLQVGCKIWRGGYNENGVNEFIQYQDHIAAELEKGTQVGNIRDPKYNEPVVFTMAGILADTAHVCPEESPEPTLRVIFDDTAIFREGILGTRSQCVLGLHNPKEKVCYPDDEVLGAADAATTVLDTQALIYSDGPQKELTCNSSTSGTPIPDRYIKDPALNLHITENRGGTGYRWRNGALTVQLLDAGNFAVQAVNLPKNNKKARVGGIYAKAFTAVTSSNGQDKMTYFTNYSSANQSGLLYEADIYWHYSDLADNIQRGDPSSVPCYGDPNYGGSISQETRGLVNGQYKVWADALRDTADLAAVADLIGRLDKATSESDIAQAMLELNELLAGNDALAEWWQYRQYIPGSNVPDSKLLDIDKNLVDPGAGSTSTEDAIPAEVVNIETIDLETLGPNAVEGRRNWIDIRQ